ncbi:hypothetical protein [Burkholderia sp. RF2-non_BP3]|uniref:hypothetical protein n=1 Tax=Burkholderia sp. RF2-non_BP3 TaxID=1637844 RepID=UPI0007566650|nr:hypothetical protein [Burkholderia sp. RF2-non_BP3]KUY54348.1 hypothetical protein WS45_20940 [Burkholderia sp. RF2-non_BP3]
MERGLFKYAVVVMCAMVGIAGYNVVDWKRLDAASWAAWVQAVGGIFAVIAAFGVARYTIRADQKRKAREESVTQAADLLALHHIAAELEQMCILTNFEKSNLCERTIYPDAAGEFRSIAELVASLPVINVVTLGEMEMLLELRRTATFCSRIFEEDGHLKGDEFVLKHRRDFAKFHDRCAHISTHMWDRVEEVCPGHFTDKRRMHL